MPVLGKSGFSKAFGGGIELAVKSSKFEEASAKKPVSDYLIMGSNQDDLLSGNDLNNLILGFDGDDMIDAGAGNDQVLAGKGDDTVEGGLGDDKLLGMSGFDTAVYAGSILDFQVLGFGSKGNAPVVVHDLNAADGDEGRDTLFHFEALAFSDYTLDLTGGNNAPLVAANDFETDEDTAIAVSFEAYDFDSDALSLVAIQVTGGGTLVEAASPSALSPQLGTGLSFNYTFDPNGAYDSLGNGASAIETITVTVEDEHGLQTQVSFEVTINGLNADPVASDGTASGDEDTTISGTLAAADPDGDSLTFALETGPTEGVVTINPGGSFDYTPAADFNGTDSFTYEVSDGNGGTDTATVTINVLPVNDAPFLVSIDENDDNVVLIDNLSQTINEADGPVQFDLNPVFDDIDNQTLTYSLITITNLADGRGIKIPASIVGGILTLNPSSFGLAEGETIDVRVAVQADDGSGALNSSVVGTFDLTINGSDDPTPVNSNSAPTAPDQDLTEGDQEPIVIDLNALVFDPDTGDTLTIIDVTIPPVGREGVEVEFTVANGVITIDPAQFSLGEGEEFNVNINYTVDDGSGQPNSSASGEINLTVISGDDPAPPQPNTAPVATDGTTTTDATAQDIVIDLSTLASDPDGDDLTFDVSIRAGEQVINFSVVGTSIVIPWAQAQLFGLADGNTFETIFDYTVSDGSLSDSGSVSLSVNGPFDFGNAAPSAGNNTQDVNVEDGTFTVNLGALVSDSDGDPITFTSVEVVLGEDESGATITVPVVFDAGTGLATINPVDFGLSDGEALTASLNYTIDDGSGAANSAASGQVVLNVSDPVDETPPPPGPTILDFEPIGQPGEYSVDMITLYDGFVFSGDLGVFSNNDQPPVEDGRGGFTPEPGIMNGATSGDNVLVLRDGTMIVTGPVDGPDDTSPELFDLNAMNITAASSDGVTVTITAFVLEFVPGVGQELVAQGSVDILVNTSGPTVFDTSLLGAPKLFVDINAFEITTDSTDTLELVIDDMSLTYTPEDPLIV